MYLQVIVDCLQAKDKRLKNPIPSVFLPLAVQRLQHFTDQTESSFTFCCDFYSLSLARQLKNKKVVRPKKEKTLKKTPFCAQAFNSCL